MQTVKSFNWSSIVAALFALGIVTTADPLLAAISLVGMVIVATLNFVARRFGTKLKAAWLTIALFVVSLVLALIFDPIALPAFPAYPGDPVTFAQAIAELVESHAPLVGSLVAFATLIYNALKPIVFDKYFADEAEA